MTITFGLPGLGGLPIMLRTFLSGQFTPTGTLPKYLGGEFAPVTAFQGVPYNWLKGPNEAMTNLDTALLAAPAGEQLIVMGHSEGAWGCIEWLKQKSESSPIDADRLLFITMGSSWRTKLTWLIGHRHRCIDITAQWEQYADAPDLEASLNYELAAANVKAGAVYPAPNLHGLGYRRISLDDAHWESQLDRTTWMLFETPTVPLPGAAREDIESAYYRPYLVDMGGRHVDARP